MTLNFDVLAEGLGFTEGPVALADGSLAVTSISHASVYVFTNSGERSVISTGGGPNGMAAGSEGSLYVAQNGGLYGGASGCTPGIQRIFSNTVEQLVSLEDGAAPNDLCFGPDAWLYVTDTHGVWDGVGKPPIGQLLACRPDGSDLRLLYEGFEFMNGLAFDPTGQYLYVVETGRSRIWRFPWADGPLLGEPVELCRLASGNPDGIAVDSMGSIWVAATTDASVQVFDPEGKLIQRYSTGPGSVPTNCCFGIDDPSILYVTDAGTERVLSLATNVTGVSLYRPS